MSDFSKIEEGRAMSAYEAVEEAKQYSDDIPSKYRSYVERLPAMIQVNGLGQAIAFYYKKKEKDEKKEADKGKDQIAYSLVYRHIDEWLKKKMPNHFDCDQELIKSIISLEVEEYRMVTMEVQAFLSWLCKFVGGMIEKNK